MGKREGSQLAKIYRRGRSAQTAAAIPVLTLVKHFNGGMRDEFQGEGKRRKKEERKKKERRTLTYVQFFSDVL